MRILYDLVLLEAKSVLKMNNVEVKYVKILKTVELKGNIWKIISRILRGPR